VTELAQRLRLGRPPVIGRIEHDELLLDPRTVAPEDDSTLVEAVVAALGR
jgi:L-seryl-tRNA(Ser) seleniumtransferase